MVDSFAPSEERSKQIRQFLATGFRNVDASGDTGACSRFLDLLAGIPFFHKVKEETFRIIAAAGPATVLDAGCGSGTDLVALASRLPENCRLTGLDASESLLSRASTRTAAIRDRCSLIRGDITAIPCRDGTFGACRIDRVLQHIMEPERAVQELARVLQPGGTLVAFDNDWDTFSISLDDTDMADRICRSWRDSFASSRIGRDLPAIFQQCGLLEIHAEPRTLTMTDFSLAEQVFDLPVLLGRMVAAGTLTPQESAAVQHELRERARDGTFSSGYTGFLVWGRRPA